MDDGSAALTTGLVGVAAQEMQHRRVQREHRPQLRQAGDGEEGPHQKCLGQQAHGDGTPLAGVREAIQRATHAHLVQIGQEAVEQSPAGRVDVVELRLPQPLQACLERSE